MRSTIGIASVAGVLLALSAMGQALPPPSVSVPGEHPLALDLAGPGIGPRIQFAEHLHDFGTIQAGETLKYTFVYTNTGLATLEIQQVRTSCGCTTAGEWDKRVEPGATGKIPIQFRSANFSGPIQKSVTVICNDPQRSNVMLGIKGTVWVPVEVTPKTVMFQYDSESPAEETRKVRILSNLKEPLKLSAPVSGNPAFRAKLETITEGKEYALLVSTVPPIGTGMITAAITVEVADTNVQPFQVQVYALERQPLMISPSQLLLPAGPIRTELRPSFSIRTHSPTPLELSEPSINIPGVKVELKELQPGRLFSLTPTFPAGFELPAGQRVEVSVKTNHPKRPVIRVPVVQPRQVARGPVRTISVRPLPVPTSPAPPTPPSR